MMNLGNDSQGCCGGPGAVALGPQVPWGHVTTALLTV